MTNPLKPLSRQPEDARPIETSAPSETDPDVNNERWDQVNSRLEMLEGSLKQLREDLNLLASSLREDDLTYAHQSSQEISNAVSMLRVETENYRFDLAGNLRQEFKQQLDQAGEEHFSDLMNTRTALHLERFVRIQQDALDILPPEITPEKFERYLEKFIGLHPHLFDIWASYNLDGAIGDYKANPHRSCSVPDRPNAVLFRGFAAPYLSGRVLDVGCGPYPVPYYLADYPVNLISGLDPLEPYESHPFQFVRGFSEFLPWHNSTFDVVTAATSMDHFLSLELSLSEIRRVLKPGGILLVWDWFSPEGTPYQPEEKTPELIDDYHLFHFSEGWFEELMGRNFQIIEKIRLKGFYEFDRFYSLKLFTK